MGKTHIERTLCGQHSLLRLISPIFVMCTQPEELSTHHLHTQKSLIRTTALICVIYISDATPTPIDSRISHVNDGFISATTICMLKNDHNVM